MTHVVQASRHPPWILTTSISYLKSLLVRGAMTSLQIPLPRLDFTNMPTTMDNSASRLQSPASSSVSDPFSDAAVIPPSPNHLAGSTFTVARSLSEQDGSSASASAVENVASDSSGLITIRRREVENPVFHSPELIKAGKRKIFISKWVFIAALVACK
jgi:hypothetical protein